MTRKQNENLENKRKKANGIFKKCLILLMVVFVIVGALFGGFYGYDMSNQKPLTQKELDEMKTIAEILDEDGAGAIYERIKSKYEITIEDEQIKISTLDSTKGILQVDFSNDENQYEVIYRYSQLECVFTTIAYGIIGGIVGFAISIVVSIIASWIFDRIIIRVKN